MRLVTRPYGRLRSEPEGLADWAAPDLAPIHPTSAHLASDFRTEI